MKKERKNPRTRASSVRGRQNKNQKKRTEECPLCKISEETISRLKKSKDQKTEEKLAKNNEKSRNRK